jgi:hypothetical protein
LSATFGNLPGASGGFFCAFGGVPLKSCASTEPGTTALIAARRIAIRQLRATGNLKAMVEL